MSYTSALPTPSPTAATTATRLSIEVAALTHRGARRPRNEDALTVGRALVRGLFPPVHRERFESTVRPLLLIADGMGGHPGGDVASCHVASRLAEMLDRKRAEEEIVRAAVQEVNRELYATMQVCPAYLAMGTTVAGLHIGDGSAVAFNVGDSRVYRLTAGRLAQISADDRSPGGELTGSLGGALRFADVDPHVVKLPLEAGDVWLLCSDGLSDLVEPEEIAAALDGGTGAAAARLLELALTAGGHDNVSVIVARVAPSRPGRRKASERWT
jgi:serine/threonine protein phosphatase PrpC